MIPAFWSSTKGGSTGGWYQRSEAFENPQITAAREQRDARIEAWAAAGMSNKEISVRVGLVEATVARILRIRRLEAQEGRGRA